MSGHSKWATTKHKKAVVDAKRSKLFAKLVKTIEVAARNGGADLAGNPNLADAVAKAKGQSVPNENIDRAIKRGSGALADAAAYEEITYEAYATDGVAMLVECLTDNRNRAASDVRVAITRNGGRVADPGSVAYLFQRKGIVLVDKEGHSEDDVLLAVLDAGAEEVNDLDDTFEVVCEATDLQAVRAAVTDAGSPYSRPTSPGHPPSPCPSMKRLPARCYTSSTPSKTSMTCRTSGSTLTSPTRSWSSCRRSQLPKYRHAASPPSNFCPSALTSNKRSSFVLGRLHACARGRPGADPVWARGR
jgi:YebC/PmpR family DNA-binding regulatory protein